MRFPAVRAAGSFPASQQSDGKTADFCLAMKKHLNTNYLNINPDMQLACARGI